MHESCLLAGAWMWRLHCSAPGCRRKGQMWAVGDAGLKMLFVAKETSGTICKARVLLSGTLWELNLFSPWVSYSLQLCRDYLLHTSTANAEEMCAHMSTPLAVNEQGRYKPHGFQSCSASMLWVLLLNKVTWKAWPLKKEVLWEWQPHNAAAFWKAWCSNRRLPAFNRSPRTLMKVIRTL